MRDADGREDLRRPRARGDDDLVGLDDIALAVDAR